MGLSDRLRSYWEYRRLQRRYLNRSKRTHFASDAEYKDGEYVHYDHPSHILATPSPAQNSTRRQSSSNYSQWGTFAHSRSTSVSNGSEDGAHVERGHPPATPSYSNAVLSRPRTFESDLGRRDSHLTRSSVASDWDGHGAGMGTEDSQRKERRRMTINEEFGWESRDTGEMDSVGELPPRPYQGTWLGRRRSMLGRA